MVFVAKPVEELPSFGGKLKKAREEAGLTKEKVVQLLNWPGRYLERLERGEIDKLPPDVYSKGFLRKYAALLGLPEEALVAEYEKEAKIVRHLHSQTHQSLPQLAVRRLVITPQTLGWLGGAIVAFFVLGYLGYQLHFLVSPPALTVSEPAAAELTVESAPILLKGQTEPGSKLTINGQLTYIDKDGNFEQSVNLDKGLNVIKIEATNRFGKSSVETRQVMLK